MKRLPSKKAYTYYTGLILSHVFMVLVSIIIIGAVTYQVAVGNLLEEVQETNAVILKNVSNTVNMVLGSVNNLSVRLAMDPGINEFSRLKSDSEDSGKLQLLRIIDQLESSKNSMDFISSIYLYYHNSGVLLSSPNGKYYLNDFYDTSWLKTYNDLPLEKRIFHWDGPRRVSRKGSESTSMQTDFVREEANNTWVISNIRPLSLIPDVKNGLVVVNIHEKTLQSMYENEKFGKTGYMFIVNSEGRIISHKDKRLLNTINWSGYMERILKENRDMSFVFNDDRQKLYISVRNSDKNDWKYVVVIPYSEVVERVDNVKRFILAICIAYLLIGLLLSYAVSRRMYKPIGNILKLLKDKSGQVQNGERYDISDLSSIMNKIIDRNTNLQLMWDKYFPLLEERFLVRILKGRVLYREELQERLKLVNLEFRFYAVFLINFDDYKEIREELGEQELNLIKMYIYKSIDDYFSSHEGIRGRSVDVEDDKFTVLLGFNEKINTEQLYEAAEALKRSISDTRLGSYTFGVSKITEGAEQIRNCYRQALDALEHRFYIGKGNIILINDVQPIRDDVEILLSEKEEESILGLLRSYDSDKLILEINSKLEERFVNHKLNFEYIQPILTQLIHITNRFIYEQGYSLNDVIADFHNFLTNMMRVETLDEAKYSIQTFMEKIFIVLKESKESKNSLIIENIQNYIRKHFDKEISLDSIADQVFISKFYLSKLFKKETGMNFNEYLINIRIEKAKELLAGTNDKIFEIAQKVGYVNHKSFTKIFRENTGVTPIQYREQVALQKMKE